MKLSFEWNTKELQKKLDDMATLQVAKAIVKTNGAEMEQKIVRNAVFKGDYTTGATRQSVTGELFSDGLAYRAGPHTEYSPYVEYGTRYMSAQPFVRPAFNAQKEQFKSDLERLVQ